MLKHTHYDNNSNSISGTNYSIYSNARQVPPFKCGSKICEVILNPHTKCWTRLREMGLLSTGPCMAKARPTLPDQHVRPTLLWGTLQRWVVIPYWHLDTNYQSSLQGSRDPKERTGHDECYLTWSSFWGPFPSSDFMTKYDVSEGSWRYWLWRRRQWH